MNHSNIAIFIPHKGCPYACSFCDQKSISGEMKNITCEEVRKELSDAFGRSLDVNNTEIAFFGGSFTCIDKEDMISFLKEAYPYVEKNMASGIRISTRPDGINEEILQILKKYKVTAIELGAQSLNDDVLKLNRRGHTEKDVLKASEFIKEYGFSLGLQIMVGLYGDRKESLYETVRKVIRIKPDTVRIYPTVVIKGTYLDELRFKGLYAPVNLGYAKNLSANIIKMFEDSGIKVIRVGLHASKTLEEKKTGGSYHPAFRELCESEIKRLKLKEEIFKFPKGSSLKISVSSSEVSKTIGQKKCNLRWAEKEGYHLLVKEDSSLKKCQMKVEIIY